MEPNGAVPPQRTGHADAGGAGPAAAGGMSRIFAMITSVVPVSRRKSVTRAWWVSSI